MTEPKEEPALEEQTSEEAAPEETRAKEEQESNSILSRLVSRTKPIGFFGPILVILLFPLFLSLGSAASPAVRVFLGAVFALLFIALPIFLLVGLSQSQGERPRTEPQDEPELEEPELEEPELEETELEETELEETELEETELEETTLEETALEEATLEETQTKEEQEFNSILSMLVSRTKMIGFFAPIFVFLFFPLFLVLGAAAPPVVQLFLGAVFILLFLALPISSLVGLFSCLLLWGAPTTNADLKGEIIVSAIANVFTLVFSGILPLALRALILPF